MDDAIHLVVLHQFQHQRNFRNLRDEVPRLLKGMRREVQHIYRYGLLQKLGAKRQQINHSLFIQIAVFFAVPLLAAGLYQLGLIICKKDSTQAFRTDDLNSNIFKFSRDVLVEYNS